MPGEAIPQAHENWLAVFTMWTIRQAPKQLKRHGIERIVVIGMIANTCIESTSRFGMELGYHITW
jgi:nicotinamidase-related amidase